MADADVFAVGFRDAVQFAGRPNKGLYRERDKCVLVRVPGGLIATPVRGGMAVYVPDANCAWMELMPAQKAKAA